MIEAFENEKLKHTSIYNLLQEKYSTTVKELEDKNKELIKYQEVLNNNNNLMKDLEKVNTEGKKILSGLKKEKEILKSEKDCLIEEQNSNLMRINQLEEQVKDLRYVEIPKLKEDNIHLTNIVQENKIGMFFLLSPINFLYFYHVCSVKKIHYCCYGYGTCSQHLTQIKAFKPYS